MSSPIDRARRLARTAHQAEDVAAAELQQANRRLREADDDYRRALERSADLAATPLAPGLRGLLVTSGARAQATLAAERDELLSEAGERRRRWDEARTRTRSMEKLVERAVRQRTERRLAAELAELGDVIAARAALAMTGTAGR